jgi:hypothetical protein
MRWKRVKRAAAVSAVASEVVVLVVVVLKVKASGLRVCESNLMDTWTFGVVFCREGACGIVVRLGRK